MSATTASQHTTNGSHVRVTRRGRVLLLLALVAVLFAAFSLGRSASQAAPTADGPSAPAQHVVVQPGESLWTVAQRTAPDHDPREVVARLRELNGLTTSQLQPGQQLIVPRAA